MKTKKTKKSSVTKIKTFTVTEDTDLSELYDPSAFKDIHVITGYTIVMEKGNVMLRDSTDFRDCTFVSKNDDDIIIVSTGTVNMDNCVVTDEIHLRTDGSVRLESCKGSSVILSRNPASIDATATFQDCAIQLVSVSDYLSVKMRGCKATSVFVKQASGLIDLESTEISSERFFMPRLALYRCTGCSVTLINARMENADLAVDDSFIRDFQVGYSSIHRILVHRTVLDSFCVHLTSSVGLIDARNASCGSPARIEPARKPLVTSYMAAGFPRFDATMYKKVLMQRLFHNKLSGRTDIVLELSVPERAEARYSSFTRKIRVSEARVVRAYVLVRNQHGVVVGVEPTKVPLLYTLFSSYDASFKYRIGRRVKPRKKFDMSDAECSSGIHGFLDIMDAATY